MQYNYADKLPLIYNYKDIVVVIEELDEGYAGLCAYFNYFIENYELYVSAHKLWCNFYKKQNFYFAGNDLHKDRIEVYGNNYGKNWTPGFGIKPHDEIEYLKKQTEEIIDYLLTLDTEDGLNTFISDSMLLNVLNYNKSTKLASEIYLEEQKRLEKFKNET